jgi:hypothetical protein
VVLHNHVATYVETEDETAQLLGETDPTENARQNRIYLEELLTQEGI